MTDSEPEPTQRDVRLGMTGELEAAGFDEVEEIGRGGFGVVLRALQPELGRTVAVKMLSADLDEENRNRFLREEQAMGRLSGHPNIVEILHVDVTFTGRPFIVMPYHARGSLEGFIRDRGPLGWAEAVRIGVKLCGAVESAHRIGILHRDIKPANVLLTAYGEAQLTDFGIARVPGGFRTSSDLVAGSPAFTAPEILEGRDPTVASDVYGLGALLFALMTGHAAFERKSGEKVVAQFLRITTQPIPDLREQSIPDDLARVIESAMSTDPAARPSTAAQFGALLAEVQHSHGLVPDEMALLDGDAADLAAVSAAGREPPSVRGRRAVARTTVPPTSPTKFRPRLPLHEPLLRERLLDPLRTAPSRRRRLVVIHAPAGFGKSTLAAQWRDVLVGEGIAVAWLSVDRDDNNAVWFVAHLIDAIRRARPELPRELDRALEESAEDAVEYVLAELVDEIHTSATPIVVVIDDWHRIGDEATQRALDYLIDNGCRHVRLIVTSREKSGLPLSRMRVRGDLIEIDDADLRLTAAETGKILLEHNGFDLTADAVRELHAATGGWPAAVQLVALSLRGGADPAQLAADLADGHDSIGDYLTENVLDHLEPKMVEFLMAISVCDHVNAGLAATLSGHPGGKDLLEEAYRRDLFLHRIPEDPGWYRFQPLFAEFLRNRLDHRHPGRARILHMRASRWFAERQMVRESVDHAISAADLNSALDLIESGGKELIETSRIATLLGMVAKLPVQQWASRSKLLMSVARANVALQRPGPARAAFGRLSSVLSRKSGDDADTAERLEFAALQAADLTASDRVDGVVELVAECLSRADELPPWTVSLAANATSFAHIVTFDFEAARRLQQWAEGYHRASTDPLGEVYGLCYAGIAARELLDIDAATRSFLAALSVARERIGERANAARFPAALLGEMRYLHGDLDDAASLVAETHRLAPDVGPVDFMIAAVVVGARIEAVRGNLDAADLRLRTGSGLAVERDLPRLAAHVAAEQQRWGITEVEPPVVALDSQPATGPAALTAEATEAAAIRGLLATGRLDRQDEAVHRARALLDRVHDRPRAALDARVLLGDCLAAAGWTDEAKATIATAAATCAELGWGRALVDDGSRVVDVLVALRDDQRAGRWRSDWPSVPKLFLQELG